MTTFSVLIFLLILSAEIQAPKLTPEIIGKGAIPTKSKNNEPQKGTEYSEPRTPPKPSPPPQLQPSTDTVDSQPNASKKENTREKSLWQRIFDWIVARTVQDFFTFIIAIATVFLAIFTGKLVRVTRDMHKATEDSAKATKVASEVARLGLNIERPYIFVESQKLQANKGMHLASMAEEIGIDHSKMDIKVSFQLVNEGKGIAVIHAVRFQARITPGIFDVIASNRAFGRNVLPKSTQLPITQQIIRSGNTSPYSARFSLPIQDWQRMISKENQIFIVGLVSYRDVFGRQFKEPFRFGYEPPFEGIPGSPIVEFHGALYVSRKNKKRNEKKQTKSNPRSN